MGLHVKCNGELRLINVPPLPSPVSMWSFSVRVAGLKNPDMLLTDTVGFIQKLPTNLVAAFRATLEEITEADVLLVSAIRSPVFITNYSITRSTCGIPVDYSSVESAVLLFILQWVASFISTVSLLWPLSTACHRREQRRVAQARSSCAEGARIHGKRSQINCDVHRMLWGPLRLPYGQLSMSCLASIPYFVLTERYRVWPVSLSLRCGTKSISPQRERNF